jgi:putative membrane protein
MKRFTYLFMLVVVISAMYSCSSMFSTAGRRSDENDSTNTFGNRSIVGTSNTPGTPRTGDYGGPTLPIRATANTTGPSPAPGDTATNSALSFETQRFIRLVSFSRMTEVQISKIALSRSKNSNVREYASRLVAHQNRISEDIRSVSTSKDMAVFDLDQSASDELTAKMDKLNKAPEEQFDEIYIKMITKEQRDAVKIFDQGTEFKDPAIREFSKRNLPALKTQLKDLESLL